VEAFDEQAVAGLYRELMDGWNRGSGADFAATLTPDVEFIGFDGTWFHGREAVEKSHQSLFDTHLKGTRLIGKVVAIRFLAPDVAVMHAQGNTILRGKSVPSPSRESLQTLVAVKREGAWRLAAFQNTRIRPMGQSLPNVLLWLVGDKLWYLALRMGGQASFWHRSGSA
jgi:uncharacterized protein (TIGR02246 family)